MTCLEAGILQTMRLSQAYRAPKRLNYAFGHGLMAGNLEQKNETGLAPIGQRLSTQYA